MENFNLKQFLVENRLTTNSKLLKEEVTIPTDVKDFFLQVAANQLGKVQKYNYHDYLQRSNPERKKVAGRDYNKDEPGAFYNLMLDDPEYKEWCRVYDQVHDFMMPQNVGKEFPLGNGATVSVVGKGDDLTKIREFIIRK